MSVNRAAVVTKTQLRWFVILNVTDGVTSDVTDEVTETITSRVTYIISGTTTGNVASAVVATDHTEVGTAATRLTIKARGTG